MFRPIAFDRSNPCPICGRVTRCSRTDDGLHLCKGNTTGDREAAGFFFIKTSDNGDWGLFRQDGDTTNRPTLDPKVQAERRKREQWDNWTAWQAGVGRDLTPVLGRKAAYDRLRGMLPRFTNNVFDQLSPVFIHGSNTDNPITTAIGFPEVNGDGDVIGISFRYPNGFKQSAGSRGITVPARLAKLTPDQRPPHRTVHTGPLFIVEGASDVLAMCEMGLDAIGRPSNCGGAEELAEWITKYVPRWRQDVIVMGENDRKEDGRHPGLDGAKRVSHRLSELLGISVRYAMPPAGSKDVRDWYTAEVTKPGRTPGNCGHTWLCQVPRHSVSMHPGEPLTEATAPESPEAAAALDALLEAVEKVAKQSAADQAARREAEEAAAKAVQQARADHDRLHGMRCGRPRSVVLHDLVTNGPRVQYLRCEDYVTCQGCRRWRIFREACNATLRFQQHAAAAGQPPLWELNVAADRWNALRRRINRLGGQYHRTHEDCDGSLYYVVTTVHVPGSIMVRPDVAASTVRLLLDAYTEQPRPVATSHGWKLPQVEQRVERYRRVGMGSRWLTLRVLRDIADALGCDVGLHVGEDGQSRCVVACDLVRRKWSDADRDYAFDCLQAGEVLARLDDTTFTFTTGQQHPDPLLDTIPW